jgi:hypothetical protein
VKKDKKMQCERFEQMLERQEGPLPEPALSHLESCEGCRNLMADFGAIHDVAVALGAEGVAPPERVWIALRNQLEAEGMIHELEAEPARHAWWAAFQRPAFAGSFLALILAAAAAVSYQYSSPLSAVHTLPATEDAAPFVPSAESVFKEEMLTVGAGPILERQDSAVTDSIRRNLRVVDNFIAMCEKSVHEQPDNQMAREYLYGAYQQKAELLAAAMSRSTGGLQ